MGKERSNISTEFKKSALIQKQSLPLEQKILLTKHKIREWYDYWDGQVYVSFSGGKDSTVLKHIVDGMYNDIPAVFVNTGLEYPEIQKFVRDIKAGKFGCFNSDVEIIRPEMRFDEVIQKYGYPVISKEVSQKIYDYRRNPNGWAKDRFDENSEFVKRYGKSYSFSKWIWLRDSDIPVSDRCCHIMKKKPAKLYEKETGRKPFIGSMASESRNRKTAWMKNGCNAFGAKRQTSQPMSFWTEQDILHYIKKYNVPYCPVYGDIRVKPKEDAEPGQMNVIDMLECYEPDDVLETTGCTRTGCMFCMFGCHLEKEPNRFQRMKVTHPKQYAYCMEQLGLKEVLEYIGIPYE